MKKLLACVLALSIALTLAACGGSASQASAPSAAAGSSTSQEADIFAKPVEITIMNYLGNQVKLDAWQHVLDSYTALHPNVTFDSQAIEQGNYITQLRTRIAGGDYPDIMMGQPSQYTDIVEGGYVMDLTDSDLVNSLGLNEDNLGDCSYNGKVYALPLDFKTYGIMYNKDIFEQYHLSVPKNEAELMEVCKTLKDNGVDPWIRNYSSTTYPDIEVRAVMWPAAQEAGEYDVFDKLMKGELAFEDCPSFMEAMSSWTKRMKYSRTDDMTNDTTAGRQKFAAGEGAMMYEGTWAYATIESYNPDGNFGMFVMPRDGKDENTWCIQLDQIFMVSSKMDADKEAVVLDFMKYLCSADGGASIWTEETLNPSVIPGVDNSKLPEVIAVACDAMNSGKIAHAGNWTAQLSGEYLNTWRTMLQGYAAEGRTDTEAFAAELTKAFAQINATK